MLSIRHRRPEHPLFSLASLQTRVHCWSAADGIGPLIRHALAGVTVRRSFRAPTQLDVEFKNRTDEISLLGSWLQAC